MDMPPSRYRVVEQGRRLVVIDTLVGEAVHPIPRSIPEMPGETRRRMEAPRALDRPAPPARPTPSGRDAIVVGVGLSFTTARWFDNAGPRTIRISQNGQGQAALVLATLLIVAIFFVALIGWPILMVLGFVLLQKKARDGFRTAVTTWLSALDTNKG